MHIYVYKLIMLLRRSSFKNLEKHLVNLQTDLLVFNNSDSK